MGAKKKSENTYSNIEEQFAVEQGYQNFVPRNLLIASSKINNEISSENSMPLKTRQNQVAGNRRQKARAPTICGIKLSLLKRGLLILLFFFLIILTILLSLYILFRPKPEQNVEKYTSVILLEGYKNEITNSTLIYNSAGKSWNKCHLQLPEPFFQFGATVLNNKLYIFGGQNPETLSSVYKLEADNEWRKMTDMNEKRTEITKTTFVFKSEIWVIGGWNGTHTLNTVEKYNPKTNNWTKMSNLREARYAAAASIVNGKIYVSGGFDKTWLQTMEVYDPAKKKWKYFYPLPYGLTDHCSIADGRNLMIIGGKKDGDTFSNEVWKIDVTDPEKEWIQMTSFNQERRYHGAIELEDGLMIFGGILNDTTRLNSVKIFNGTNWNEGPLLPEKLGQFAFIPLTRKQEETFLKQFCTTE